MKHSITLLFILLSLACGRSDPAPLSERLPEASHFTCADNVICQPVGVVGDPTSSQPTSPMTWRGYGDPSIEHDPVSGTTWMIYSWLASIDWGDALQTGAVRTHLARKLAGAERFEFVAELSENTIAPGPINGAEGFLNREVPSLLLRPDGQWEAVWLSYHKDRQGAPYQGFAYLDRSVAAEPNQLGLNARAHLGTAETHESFGVDFTLDFEETADCTLITEPALMSHQGRSFLGLNCVIFGATGRQSADERFFLLEWTGTEYEFIGNVLTGSDASYLGADRIEQVDLATSQSGTVLLIGTPIQDNDSGASTHLGCYVMEFDDFAAGQLRRDSEGNPVILATVVDPDSQPSGQGACTYDAELTDGLVTVRRELPPSSNAVTFTLLATGLHF